MYRRLTSAALLLAALAACSREKEAAQTEKAKSERERDSLLGQSKIPGATGVGKAMKVADSAGSRVELQDSIAKSD